MLKAKGEIVFAYIGKRQPTWILFMTEKVFYYTEALVLFCNANVNIFFSCINDV